MQQLGTLIKRELMSYFTTPVAYVFIVIFLLMSSLLTFYMGNFFARGQADLIPFFNFHPLLFLFFIPALSMRLWAEERRLGTIELLLTLPIGLGEAVFAKFLAAWIFCGLTLLLTFPLWITVNYLGTPDNGVIFASYCGSFALAGAYLAIGCCFSSLTKNQVVAFILTVVVCLLFVLSGLAIVQDTLGNFLPGFIVDAIASLSFLSHFSAINKGVIDVRDAIFFGSMIAFWLYINVHILELKKAQ